MLSFLRNVLIFALLLTLIVGNKNMFVTGEIPADDIAKDMAATLDLAMLSSNEISILNACPKGNKFKIDGNLVEGINDAFIGTGEAVEYFITPQNSILPDNVNIDCQEFSFIRIEKTYENNRPKLSVVGFNEETEI